MSSVVRDAIAAELALLTRRTTTPVAPLGFGHDLYNDGDFTEDMREVGTENPTLLLGLALMRRLDCPRGALDDDGDYGIDLRSYCNRGTPAQGIRDLAGDIRRELLKDDRVDSTTVTVTPSPTGQTLGIAIRVVPVDPALGGFSLILAVTSADVVLEEIRRAA